MIPFPIPDTVRSFARFFSQAGFSLYIVGGAVRDYYLDRASTDFDFATDAMPEEVQKLFHTVLPTGIKHGTVTVLFKNQRFEVTTFRVDGEYHDMRHPDSVQFVRSLSEDLKRRDFTINALAVHAYSGELVDLHQGLQDLERKTIAAIGDPVQRFTEDALRIMRACRFACQLDFSIEKRTKEAMRELSGNLSRVSAERIREEFMKILSSLKPSDGLLPMDECGALDVILPELTRGKHILQRGAHRYDVFTHCLVSCDAAPQSKPLVRMAALLHDIGKVDALKMDADGFPTFFRHGLISADISHNILMRLKFSNEDREIVENLIRNHMFHYTPDWTDGAVRRFINTVGLKNIPDLFDLRLADQVGISGSGNPKVLEEFSQRITQVLEKGSALRIADLAIDGRTLEELGIPKGPVMGLIFKELLETVLDDPSQNETGRLRTIAGNFYLQRVAIGDHSPTSSS